MHCSRSEASRGAGRLDTRCKHTWYRRNKPQHFLLRIHVDVGMYVCVLERDILAESCSGSLVPTDMF